LDFKSDICLFILLSSSLRRVPLSSRCLATSAIEVGFLGEMLSSSANEMWLIVQMAFVRQKKYHAAGSAYIYSNTTTMKSTSQLLFDTLKTTNTLLAKSIICCTQCIII
jgi:hypothetical protein